MANIDAPMGLQPLTSPNGTIKATLYPITVAYGTALYRGDPVLMTTTGTVEVATTTVMLGAAIGFYDVDLAPLNYYVASTATQCYALVADDPMQEFLMQEDSDGASLALADMFGNGTIVATVVGSTITGLSGYELDSSTVDATAANSIRVSRLHRVTGNAYGTHGKYVVSINNHQKSVGIVGVGLA